VKVYFFIGRPSRPGWAAYEHQFVALGEGFQELGIECLGSRDYWIQDDGRPLIREAASDRDDIDVWFLSNHWIEAGDDVPTPFTARKTGRTVFVDGADGWRTYSYDPLAAGFDLALKCHFNGHYRAPANCRPWAFGLTNRIIEATRPDRSWGDREQAILANYRVGHPVRVWGDRFVASTGVPVDRATLVDANPSARDHSLFDVTGGRHNRAYYARLKGVRFVAAFGGGFYPALSRAIASKVNGAAKRVVERFRLRTRTIIQFDSWRFWETLAAGAVALHADFSLFGMKLPEMPGNGVHYFGLGPGCLSAARRRFQAMADGDAQAIAGQGREWALANYSPRACAQRALDYLSEIPVNKRHQG
jgi:hypothetical protein